MKRFIEAIRQYPCLWDTSSREYRNIDKKEAAWQSIVDGLNLVEIKDVKEAKSEWKKLRDNHRDSLKRSKNRSGPELTNMNFWRYAEAMKFLLPHMKNRIRCTNLSTDTQTSEIPDVPVDVNINYSETSVLSTNDTIYNTTADVYQGGRTEAKKRKLDNDLVELIKEMEQNHQKRKEDRDTRRRKKKEHAQKDKGAIELFMESMAVTIKDMPTWMQTRVKKKIFTIVTDAEEELENYCLSDTPDYAHNIPGRSARTGKSTSGETMNNTIPAAVGP